MKFERNGLEVAVIGLSGRFPGSDLIEVFWENLINGSEFISTFSRNGSRQKIQAGAVLDKIDLFDADFFDFSPKDAEIIDPQHRLLLECAWEALENAGCDSAREERPIGVYAGIGSSTYSLYNLSPNHLKESLGFFPTLLACDRDYAPTRVSYKLNLTGPSISIGTACSSSLVAVHLAYKGLLSGECDIAWQQAFLSKLRRMKSRCVRREFLPMGGALPLMLVQMAPSAAMALALLSSRAWKMRSPIATLFMP